MPVLSFLKGLLMIFPILKEIVNGKHGIVAFVKEHPFISFLFFGIVVVFVSVISLFFHGLQLQNELYQAKVDIIELKSENKVLRDELKELTKLIGRKLDR